ncbi:MAG TPA: CocE/NonD family hydrolase, partial [Gammaproteobacteria bacterium]|nr:CocE/NonD family hydrolase [Gammaproteobacteria bacterium]
MTQALLAALLASLAAACERKPAQPPPDRTTMVRMRDGVRLETAIWLPRGDGPFPVVLTRGYRAGFGRDARRFNAAGYAYVGQSARGHSGSEGEMKRFFPDAQDGYDTLTWISRQPWCNGDIAMYGKSFWAATQWLVAPLRHPHLKAIIPQNMNADIWQCGYRCNGALTLAMSATGRAYSRDDIGIIEKMGWRRYFSHLPLVTLDQVAGASVDPASRALWRDYVEHDRFDDYWAAISIRGDGKDGKYDRIDIPVLLMGGWYDYYAGAAFTSFDQLERRHPDVDHRIVIDATSHLNTIVGDRDFGKSAVKDEVGIAIRWLDAVLRGQRNGVESEPLIQVFTMGENRWHGYWRWPPKQARRQAWYLTPAGALRPDKPGTTTEARYRYDPADPAPTLGGNHSFIDEAAKEVLRPGPVDQRQVSARPDVLLFRSQPLTRDLRVTGPVTATLHAATSAPDTDFIVRLIDILPNGTQYNLTEGILRARFR